MRKLAFAVFLLVGTPICAQETTTYSYDALGRLQAVKVDNGPANGTNTAITYDPAGNRVMYKVTGATGSGEGGGGAGDGGPPPGGIAGAPIFIVVPMNGYTLIPIG